MPKTSSSHPPSSKRPPPPGWVSGVRAWRSERSKMRRMRWRYAALAIKVGLGVPDVVACGWGVGGQHSEPAQRLRLGPAHAALTATRTLRRGGHVFPRGPASQTQRSAPVGVRPACVCRRCWCFRGVWSSLCQVARGTYVCVVRVTRAIGNEYKNEPSRLRVAEGSYRQAIAAYASTSQTMGTQCTLTHSLAHAHAHTSRV